MILIKVGNLLQTLTAVRLNKEYRKDSKQRPVILNLVQSNHPIPFVFVEDLQAGSRVEWFLVEKIRKHQ